MTGTPDTPDPRRGLDASSYYLQPTSTPPQLASRSVYSNCSLSFASCRGKEQPRYATPKRTQQLHLEHANSAPPAICDHGGMSIAWGPGDEIEHTDLSMDRHLHGMARHLDTIGAIRDDSDAVSSTVDTPCLLYTSPSPRDRQKSRMPSSA